MEYLILALITVLCSGLIFFIAKKYITKTYPQKTEKLLNSVFELEEIGLKRNESGFNGTYRNYFVSVYATTSLKSYDVNGGDRFQVWVATAPELGQLKTIGGFLGKYIISGETNGFAYVGYLINAKTIIDAKKTIIESLNILITKLEENNIKPFSVKIEK